MSDELSEAELEEFLAVARGAMSAADPIPPEVSALAKLAFEFRSIETVEISPDAELAGVRSSDGVMMQASKNGVTIIWTLQPAHISGVVHGDQVVELSRQDISDSTAIVVDPEDGSFETPLPSGPYRLVIQTPTSKWATPWTAN